MSNTTKDYQLKELGFQWFCRNTCGLNWFAQICDAWIGAKYHDGFKLKIEPFTFWWYLKMNFRNRWL